MKIIDIDREFQKAYELASNSTKKIAPDLMLQIYSYYKRATYENLYDFVSNEHHDLIRAFKFNALQQVQELTQEEAKMKYIEIIKKLNL